VSSGVGIDSDKMTAFDRCEQSVLEASELRGSLRGFAWIGEIGVRFRLKRRDEEGMIDDRWEKS